MTYTSFSKFIFLPLMAGVLGLAVTGCGAASNVALTPGNWSMTAAPAGGGVPFYIGGNLTQNGTNLTGTLYVVSSNCFDPSAMVAFTGTVKGQIVTLTSASAIGQVINITASGSGSSALTGTYTVTGGCADGNNGNLTGTTVPSISATWSGPLVGSGGANVILAFDLTQSTTASQNGQFGISGSAMFTNSSCSNSATVSTAFIAGPYLYVSGLTDDGGIYTYIQVLLNNPSAPTSMKGEYDVNGGKCNGDSDTPTFTKQ
jgi:hypothetical protein